ncbi:hypothetical protein JTE90_027322 [Oedothorax gibbosus]|uniref:EF-hand domain-containing protein n=1 Tax=Oedothorax gibbosus TaxID=931172 RepID=A0AAV6W2J8_9ARAC|nr:hypothetical protein JTE90_027322 [Oedothorax gibbosus]
MSSNSSEQVIKLATSCYGHGLEDLFEIFTSANGKDGKLTSDTMQQWIKKAEIPDITEDDVKKYFGRDGGLDLDEFQKAVEKLANEKKHEKEIIVKELSILFLMSI